MLLGIAWSKMKTSLIILAKSWTFFSVMYHCRLRKKYPIDFPFSRRYIDGYLYSSWCSVDLGTFDTVVIAVVCLSPHPLSVQCRSLRSLGDSLLSTLVPAVLVLECPRPVPYGLLYCYSVWWKCSVVTDDWDHCYVTAVREPHVILCCVCDLCIRFYKNINRIKKCFLVFVVC